MNRLSLRVHTSWKIYYSQQCAILLSLRVVIFLSCKMAKKTNVLINECTAYCRLFEMRWFEYERYCPQLQKYSDFVPNTLSETKICNFQPEARRRASPSCLCGSPSGGLRSPNPLPGITPVPWKFCPKWLSLNRNLSAWSFSWIHKAIKSWWTLRMECVNISQNTYWACVRRGTRGPAWSVPFYETSRPVREPASFWRENVIAVVIPQRVLTRMS